MQFTSSARLIELISATLEADIFPEITSDKARAVADMLRAQLRELAKREAHLPSWMAQSLDAGMRLHQQLRELMLRLGVACDNATSDADPPDAAASGDDLLLRHAQLTTRLCSQAERLQRARADHPDPTDQQAISHALLQAAQWEATVGRLQRSAATATPPSSASDPAAGPLTLESALDFLRARHPDGAALQLTRFESIPGGFGKQTSRLTLRTASNEEVVMIARKMDPAPLMLTGLFQVEREFHLLRSLSATDYPAPRPLYLGQNVAGVDADFYVMEKLPGRVPGTYLDGLQGAASDAMILDIAEKLAALHRIPLAALSGYIQAHESAALPQQMVRDCYAARIATLRRYHTQDAEHLPSPYLVYLADWLERHLPDDARAPVLVHGDFNIHNLLVENDRVSGVLDWECAGFGAPEQDLAYIQPHISRLIDWERFLRHYEACAGSTVDRSQLPYYMAFSMFPVCIAMNRGIHNVQSARTRDIRYAMIESAFGPQFMEMGIAGTIAAAAEAG